MLGQARTRIESACAPWAWDSMAFFSIAMLEAATLEYMRLAARSLAAILDGFSDAFFQKNHRRGKTKNRRTCKIRNLGMAGLKFGVRIFRDFQPRFRHERQRQGRPHAPTASLDPLRAHDQLLNPLCRLRC